MKRGKKTARQKAVELADKECRELVMLLEPVCVICHKPGRGDPSHFFSRTRYSTRWDLRNVHNNDKRCHIGFHMVSPKPYTDFMYAKYGKVEFDALEAKSNQVTKFSTEDILAIAESLKQRRLELEGR